ncbi:MAG: site-2 protease family protein [Chloroflexi bacterium]|nr:site-2 protease family protein [Chloroflexota bacterium]
MNGFIAFVVIFGLMIFVHELGHFIVAKLAGVRVDEFGFGYPPRLVRLFTWRGTEVTLNALPLGGFVKMAEDDPTVPNSLASKGRLTRSAVYVSGAAMNALLAIVLYSIIFMMGALTPVQGPGAGIYAVSPGSPAEEVGLLPGDTILSVDGEAIDSASEAAALIKAKRGEPIELVVRREGRVLPPIRVTPRLNPPENEGALGVALDLPLERVKYPFWQAVPLGAQAAWNTIRGMWYGLQSALRKEISFQITGPIGIYQKTVEVAKTGLERLIEFTAFLSLNLFLLNLLPLPALDGGRLIFVLLEWVRGGRRIPPERESLVHAIGMIVLIALMLVVAVVDFQRYFG